MRKRSPQLKKLASKKCKDSSDEDNNICDPPTHDEEGAEACNFDDDIFSIAPLEIEHTNS